MEKVLIKTALVILLLIEFYPIETYSQNVQGISPAKAAFIDGESEFKNYERVDNEIASKLSGFSFLPKYELSNSGKVNILTVENNIYGSEVRNNSKSLKKNINYSILIKEMISGSNNFLPCVR